MQQASGHRLASARGRETSRPVGVDLARDPGPGLKFGQGHGSVLVGVCAGESLVTLRREFRKSELAVAIGVGGTSAQRALLGALRRLAGLALEDRWADWDRSPFTADSPSHVSVWRKQP